MFWNKSKKSVRTRFSHSKGNRYGMVLVVGVLGLGVLIMPNVVEAAVLKKPSNNLGLVGYWKLGVDGRQGAGELNTNWDMEDGVTSNWSFDAKTDGARAEETTDVYRGSKSARLTNSTVSSIAFWEDGMVTADGELYFMSAWVKDVDVPTTPYFSINNGVIRESASYMSGGSFSNISTTTWTHYWSVVESTSTTIDPYIRTTSNASQGDFLVDDFSVQKLQAADSSGNGNHGDLFDSITLATGHKNDNNGAFDFDGSTEYVDISSSELSLSSGSISAWFKTSDTGAGVVFGFGEDGSTTNYGNIGVGSWTGSYTDESLNFNITSGGTTRLGMYVREGHTAYQDGEWHHVVVVVDGSDNRIYIDGVEKTVTFSHGSAVTSGYFLNTDSGNDFAIGKRFYPSNELHWDGPIDEFRIYNRSLSDTEVKALYNLGKTNIGTKKYLSEISGLTHWFTFDGADTDTDTVFDVIGGNDGHIEGGAYTEVGRIGQGMYFDGTDDQVDLDTSIELGDTDWTVSAWVKTTGSGTMDILTNQSGGPVSNAFRIISNKITYYHYDGVWNTESGVTNITDGEWHHLVWANDGDTLTMDMYVDGVLDANDVDSDVTNTGPVNRIGRNWASSGAGLIGTMDDLRIYATRTLSEDEIKRIYNATRPSKINKTLTSSANDGLVGHWTFDGKDMYSNVSDVSGQGNNGTISGQSATTTTIGKIGQALLFDGTDDSVSIPDTADFDFGTGDLAVSFWFKTDSSSRMHAFNLGSGSGNNLSFDFNDGSYGVWVYWMSGGSPYIRTTTFYNDGDWHHLVFRRTGTTAELFIDNTSIGTLSNSTNIDITGPSYIGATGSSFRWDGSVDDVRVYNRTLTDAEVQALYNLGY